MPTPNPPVCLADHEAWAQARLEPGVWAYLSGGAGDEITLHDNLDAWRRIALRPRVLAPLDGLNLGVDLLGRRWPTPLLVAPMAQQCAIHPDGERATALAAAALGVGLVLSQQSNTPLDTVAQLVQPEADRGPMWFQLYTVNPRDWTLELIRHAAQVGYEALVLTVDAPVQGVRDRERRSGYTPSGPLPHRPPQTAPPSGRAQLLAQATTWNDVRWLCHHSPLPVLVKGITQPDDARQALDLGVAGVIVSNHGGRVLDTVPSTAALLPEVVDAVKGRCHVLVDGGLRRGTDVFKALALGADAVLTGRPVLHGLAHGGASGVAHVLRLLLDELWATLALCGAPSPAAIEPKHLYR